MELQVSSAPLVATGNVAEHHTYDPAIGRPAVSQATDPAGAPIWEVEVLRKDVAYGRAKTATEIVVVPSATAPRYQEYEPVGDRFADLILVVNPTKAEGLRVQWTASGLLAQPKASA